MTFTCSSEELDSSAALEENCACVHTRMIFFFSYLARFIMLRSSSSRSCSDTASLFKWKWWIFSFSHDSLPMYSTRRWMLCVGIGIDAIPCGSFTLAGQVPTGSWRDHFGLLFMLLLPCVCVTVRGDTGNNDDILQVHYLPSRICLLFQGAIRSSGSQGENCRPHFFFTLLYSLMTLFHSSFQCHIICMFCQDHLNWWSLLSLKLWFMEPYFMIFSPLTRIPF